MMHDELLARLPILGTTWTYFVDYNSALSFAGLAELLTAEDEYPCKATLRQEDGEWVVQVTNW